MDVRFYMKRSGVDDVYIDLEAYFKGMRYSKCDGLETLGKPKNIYTESYSDSDTLRVYIPRKVTREATTVTMTFYFLGEGRHGIYDRFNAFLKGNRIYYYDTARQRLAYLVLMDSTSPKEDVYRGSTPYMAVDYKFQNLWGECMRIGGDNINGEPEQPPQE